MSAFRHRQPGQTSSVELDRIRVIRNVTVFGASEVNRSLPLINFIKRADVPITFRHLPNQLSVSTVVIDVFPAVATAEPEKRPVVQPAQTFIDDFDPGLA